MNEPRQENAAALPAPTTNFEQGMKDLADFGMAIIPDMLDADKLVRTRDALYRAAASDRARGREQAFLLDSADEGANQRVWNVLSRDPLFEDLAFDTMAVEFVKAMLGWPALLGNLSANITGPGGGDMALHADQVFVPEPWPAKPQGLNVAWCLDDFTEENGATRFVPGSHRLNRAPRDEELDCDSVPITAKAGSMIVFESRVWHKTGLNRSRDARRSGVFAWYTKPIYRTQENWFLGLRPEIRQFATDDILVLLGYRTKGLGLVNGASPE